MHRSMTDKQGLVHQTVTIPVFLIVTRLWQRNRLSHKTTQGIWLR